MNHVYRTVFNHALDVWQVASELTRSPGDRGRAGRGHLRLLVLLPLAAWASLGWAANAPPTSTTIDTGLGNASQAGGTPLPPIAANQLPTGGTVSAGSGSIARNGAAMTVTQQTQNLAINWQSFDIGEHASVTFLQPNATAIALNRVLGANGSQILGQLKGNGQVWVLNPNGVLFGRSAQVDVGGLVASTLGLSDADFMAGKRSFTGSGGSVINRGNLDGGYVALLGETVRNEGTIAARLGTAALAAGNKITLDFNGDALLNVQVDEGALHALADNRGLIQADGGTVLMSARAKDALLDTAVNNTGVIRARTVENRDGRILLIGDMQSGSANIAGTLDASAPDGGNGGFIETSAAQVNIADSALITTKAGNGQSGTWLIDPNDFTVAASGGNMTGAAISNALNNNGNFIIQTTTMGTAGGNGDIIVNDSISWGANTLTLNAERNIDINAQLNGSGSAGLALEYGQGALAAGNTAVYRINAPVNLATIGSFSTKLGSDGGTVNYTLVTHLGGLNGQSGNFALINNIGSVNNRMGTLTGTLEGLGHTVSGIDIYPASGTVAGLFGDIETTGAVRNLTLAGTVTSVLGPGMYTGLLAGLNAGSIFNVHASGSVFSVNPVGAGTSVGGLVGANSGSIAESSANVAVTGKLNNIVGGLAGWNEGSISRSHASGDVAGGGSSGGLVGMNDAGTISNSYATGAVSNDAGPHSIGGLVGHANGNSIDGSLISHSYATGTVTGHSDSDVGGLVGWVSGGASSLDNVWASGAVSGGTNTGGLIGRTNGAPQLNNAHWITDSTGQNDAIGLHNYNGSNVSGFTLADARNAANWTGFTFTTTPGDSGWVMPDGVLPMLASEWSSGIGNAHQLQLMALKLGGNYALLGDINASATSGTDVWLGSSFSPIGSNTAAFTGSVNGQGFTIDGLTINRATQDYVGLFGYTQGASLHNIGLSNVAITGRGYTGGLVGWAQGTSINDSFVASGQVSARAYAGGLAGVIIHGSHVEGSYAGANVESTTSTGDGIVGGLVGVQSYTSSISNSYATGNVAADPGNVAGRSWAGGLVGLLVEGPISNSYATGSVSGNDTLGGLVGEQMGGTVSNSYATGTVSGNTRLGGLIGHRQGGSDSGSFRAITNAGGTAINSGGAFNTLGTGKTLDELKQLSTFTAAGWDISGVGGDGKVWRIYEGQTMPLLRSFMTAVTITPDMAASGKTYDGHIASGNANYTSSTPVDASLLLGDFGYATNSADAGTYTTADGSLLLGGNLHSVQQGYDIIIANTPASLTIGKAALTITANDASKTYDGTAWSGGNGVSYSGFVNGEDALSLGGTLAWGGDSQGAMDAGHYAIRASGLSSGNYAINYVDGTLTIDPKMLAIAVNLIGSVRKTYDGTTTATLDESNFLLSGWVGNDGATITATTGRYDNANAGSGKTVTIDLTLADYLAQGGTNLANYVLPTEISGNVGIVDKASATVTANSGTTTYNGQTQSIAGYTVAGLVNGEDASVLTGLTETGGSGRNAGTYAHTVSGSDGNYELTFVDGALAIDKARIVIGTDAATKTYDGTLAAAGNAVVLDGQLFGSDSIHGGDFAFTDKNAGKNKTVTVGGVTFDDGNGGGNYDVTYVANTGSTILQKTLAVSGGFEVDDKLHDGQADATIRHNALALDGVVAGDALAADWRAVFADASPGFGKTVTLDGTTLSGSDSGNYVLDLTGAPTTTASIVQAPGDAYGAPYVGALQSAQTDAAANARRKAAPATTAPEIAVLQCGQRLPALLDQDCR